MKRRRLKVTILVDNPNSWFNAYIGTLINHIRGYCSRVEFVKNVSDVKRSDILFILSCVRILMKKELSLCRNNIVVHASDLPKGRGWSPITWQVESVKSKIPVTLFEASEGCDAGKYYLKDSFTLDGTELVDEIRCKLAAKVINMVERYVSHYPMKAFSQKGKATYFRKRQTRDCELNIRKTIYSQFNKMRVADNDRYPLYFRYKGKKYIVRIYPG